MIKIFCLLIAIIYLSACNSNKNSKQLVIYQKDTSLYKRDTLPNIIIFRPNYSLVKIDTSTIELSFFNTIPETIGNPAEFYTYDTTKLSDNRFIFITDMADFAIIKNSGKEIYLAKKHESSLVISEGTFKEVYSGNGFTVVFTSKLISNRNGVSYEKGVLEIKNSKYQAIVKIHGGYEIL